MADVLRRKYTAWSKNAVFGYLIHGIFAVTAVAVANDSQSTSSLVSQVPGLIFHGLAMIMGTVFFGLGLRLKKALPKVQ
jgi:hypothetical protein